MSPRPFAPVWIALPGAASRRVDSAYEALECLTSVWPITTGSHYRRAVQACRDALDGFLPAPRARKAFLAAAREIDVLSRGVPAARAATPRMETGQSGLPPSAETRAV